MALTTGMDVAAIASEQRENAVVGHRNQIKTVKLLERCMQMIETSITATALPYATTAGWDDTQMCLVGTRKTHIDDVMTWVRTKDLSGTRQIYFIADVVGSGKTALAHSVAEQCSYAGVLVSSFFFDKTAGRTSPRQFVFNLARDLDKISSVSQHISRALRADPNLALSQPVAHLFKKLIFDPVVESKLEGPLVVIIDGLNEADTAEVQNILRTQVPKLPGTFRFFVTSRPERSILNGLGPDIPPHDLAIHQDNNRADIAIYTDYRLEEIASHHSLESWPDPQLRAEFLELAEGLFLWVATICDYLHRQVCYPDKMLERLLEKMRDSPLPPEKKMDYLYSTVLDACSYWDDEDFVDGYQQIMGVLVVQSMPLSVDALQRLHGRLPRVKAILVPLASLITGLAGASQPVQILHTSFRQYITLRAPVPRYIHLPPHNARLAILCLRMVNKLLSTKINGCGYLGQKLNRRDKKDTGIPDVEADHFTEEQWYATKFWLSHIVQVVDPTPGVMEALLELLSEHLTTWTELMASKWKYQSLIPLQTWLKTQKDDRGIKCITQLIPVEFHRLPQRLIEDSRHGEALQVLNDLEIVETRTRIRVLRAPGSETSEDSIPSLQKISDSSDDDPDDDNSGSSDEDWDW
ncbi:hypothetical protein C8J57DRAFT_734346 [Mycena rebaudengoi]|nr:hypothetical protein C8J57DRAFT_734346 [Mycena rebaudengoi]